MNYVRQSKITELYNYIFKQLYFYSICKWFSFVSQISDDELGDPEVIASLYCTFAYPYWEGCVIFKYIYLR